MPLAIDEKQVIKDIESKYYMKPIIKRLTEINKNKNTKITWKNNFDEIYKLLIKSKDDVDKLLFERKKVKLIRNIEQARKSIAGAAFSNIITYIFLKNKDCGNINKDIFISTKVKSLKGFDKISTIYIDNETQKPDCDVVIYKRKNQNDLLKCMIISLKTSLRERAGQTYKWKLLMEIATTNNAIKKKYKIKYKPDFIPLVSFATVNFYNEINKPQHRGMFKFFDKSFIAKKVDSDFILRMSSIINFLKTW